MLISPIFYADNVRQRESTITAKISTIFFFSNVIDLAIHPLHVAQSRFILQNRLPGFSSYQNFLHFIRLHFTQGYEIYKGCSGLVPINFVNSVMLGMTIRDPSLKAYGIASILSTLLTYPVYTAMRRFECQSDRPGMIPKRYKNIWHGLKLIANEEGVKGLYRGFVAYSAARTLENGLLWMFFTKGARKRDY